MANGWSLQNLAQLVVQYRYLIGSEAGFQESLARILTMSGIAYRREYDLGQAFGRIDFYLPDDAIGIELKVKGSPSGVMRQLYRYAQCPEIQALLLVTGRSRLALAPAAINSKPLLTIPVWQGQL